MLADTLLFPDLLIVSIAEPLKNGIGYKSALGFQLEKSANQLELFDDMNFTDEATLGSLDQALLMETLAPVCQLGRSALSTQSVSWRGRKQLLIKQGCTFSPTSASQGLR